MFIAVYEFHMCIADLQCVYHVAGQVPDRGRRLLNLFENANGMHIRKCKCSSISKVIAKDLLKLSL